MKDSKRDLSMMCEAAVIAALLRRHPIPALLPPIISNVIIVPLVLKFAYKVPEAYLFTVCTVGAGEIISVGILGFILYSALKKRLPHILVGYRGKPGEAKKAQTEKI